MADDQLLAHFHHGCYNMLCLNLILLPLKAVKLLAAEGGAA